MAWLNATEALSKWLMLSFSHAAVTKAEAYWVVEKAVHLIFEASLSSAAFGGCINLRDTIITKKDCR